MEKRDLIEMINNLARPLDYVKKGNNWINNKGVYLDKGISIQKSNFSNLYYINYCFHIKRLGPGSTSSVGIRLGSINSVEQKRINELLDFENDIYNNTRFSELSNWINTRVIKDLESINNEGELKNWIMERFYPGAINLKVKNFLSLPDTWTPKIFIS